MALQLVCGILYRTLIPLVLLGATIFRFNALSFIYGVLLLVAPLLPTPNSSSVRGRTGCFLRLTICLSFIFIVVHALFQASLLLIEPTQGVKYHDQLPNCAVNESIARQFGFMRLDEADAVNVIRLVIPDVAVLLTSIIFYIACRGLVLSQEEQQQDTLESPVRQRPCPRKSRIKDIFEDFGQFVVFLILGLAGIMSPSILSSVYFLSFLFIATWWSCYKTFGKIGHYFRVCLLLYSGLHLLVLYLYQFQFFQEAIPPYDSTNFYPRLFGLTGLVTYSNCSKPWRVNFHENEFVTWAEFVNPGVILLFYYLAAILLHHWLTIPHDEANGQSPTATSRKRKKRVKNAEQQSLIDDQVHHPTYSSVEHAATSDMSDAELQSEPEMQADDVDAPEMKTKSQRSAVKSVLIFTINQSYVVTLVCMMAWSIVYHSWLSFVLLIAACILWMIPNARKACLLSSPVIVFYAVVLVIIQYIFGLKLTEEEFNMEDPILYKQIGLEKTKVAFVPLLVKMLLFTGMFWLTLYQLMRTRYHASEQARQHSEAEVPLSSVTVDHGHHTEHMDAYDSREIRWVGNLALKFLRKYWILVCGALFFLMAVQEAVIYRIIYMVLFLFFVQVFQISYRVWRLLLYGFWWIVIIYSMVVLTLIYTYQFPTFQDLWNKTGLETNNLKDIGLEQYEADKLAQKLLTPTVFLIFIILQVHIFHKPFLQISDINANRDEPDLTRTEDMGSQTLEQIDGGFFSKEMRNKIKTWYKDMCILLWRSLEIHIFKLVIFTIVMVCLVNVSAVSGIFIIFIAIFLPIPKLHGLLSVLSQFWAGVVILMKMAFQLTTVPSDPWHGVCQNETENGTAWNNAPWLGLKKLASNQGLGDYVVGYIFIVLMLALQTIVKNHQRQYYNKADVTEPKHGIIFPDVKKQEADSGIVNCLKFFANYMFYKFGVEICFTMTIITISTRLDVYSILYAILLGVSMLCASKSRQCASRWWPVYAVLLSIIFPAQYLACVGAPPSFCWEYPWENLDASGDKTLLNWLFLPHESSLNAMKLLADFFQLLFVLLQWKVFRVEGSHDMIAYGGGNNRAVNEREYRTAVEIPVHDFISRKRHFLDVIITIIFQYMFWVTLALVFLAGIMRTSLFCFGYLVACFYLFWVGQDLLLKQRKRLLMIWSIVQGYNFFVIFAKACLQLVACVYLEQFVRLGEYKDENGNNTSKHSIGCILVQLLNLACLNSPDGIQKAIYECVLPKQDTAGLSWDCVCFVFLLIQRRLFLTHYFTHVKRELFVQNKLASRGAELINRILIQRVTKQKQQEAEELAKIKQKMERIKMRQERLNQRAIVEYDDHYKTIRSGGEYMFEDNSDDEETISTVTKGIDMADEADSGGKPMGPIQLLNAALESGTKEALRQRKKRSSNGDIADSDKTPTTSTAVTTPMTPPISEEEEAVSPPEDKPDADEIGRDIPVSSKKDSDDICQDDSKGGNEDEKDETTQTDETSATCCNAVVDSLKLLWALIVSVIEYLIKIMNKISFDYRRVAKILDYEMREQKQALHLEPTGYTDSDIEENTTRWQEMGDVNIEISDPDGKKKPDRLQIGPDSSLELMMEQSPEEEPDLEKSRFYRFFRALYYALVSNTEILCYFVIVINQMIFASLLSLPLPLSVFLWGMLSVPRPSKNYWVTVITYTEVIVMIKYFFQFDFWNSLFQVPDQTITWTSIVGILPTVDYATADLVVLLFVFVHRSILRRYGLWKSAAEIEEDMHKATAMESKPGTPAVLTKPFGGEMDQDDPDMPLGASAFGDTVDGNACGKTKGTPPPSRQSSVDDLNGDSLMLVKKKSETKQKRLRSWTRPFVVFFQQLTSEDYNTTTDVYAGMFACDFINFLIIVFGYHGFGPAESTSGDVQSVLSENRVPVSFLIMLLVQFALIIIDRALYLKKNVTGKFIFHLVLIIGVHVWVFFVLPIITQRTFSNDLPVQLWYFVKCIYLALSAAQIRCGYPTRVLGNFLTNKYNYLNLVLFKGFIVIPFLLELRSLMDWIWTDTTLALSSWLQMEDIYANVYVLKCWRWAEENYPTPRAQPRSAIVKYGFGGLVLFLVIFIIWFPLVLFSFANVVYEPNLPVECTVQLSIGGYQPLFKMTTQQQYITNFNKSSYDDLIASYTFPTYDNSEESRRALGFLSSFEFQDATSIRINGHSTALWGISPPAETSLLSDLRSNKDITMQFSVEFVRTPKSGLSQTANKVKFQTAPLDNKTRWSIVDLLESNNSRSVEIYGVYPRYIRVPVSNLPTAVKLNKKYGWTNISLTLMHHTPSMERFVWWEARELPYGPNNTGDHLHIISFSDRTAPSTLTLLTGYGIIGLYVSLVFVIGRFVRTFTSGLLSTIMFDELPYVDGIFRLCRNIYFVREFKAFRLEEDLFAKLIYLYRSPHIMIKWTKLKEN